MSKKVVINSRQGNKRITLLLVLKALEQMSDRYNPIRQISLAKMVNDIGGMLNLDIWCDRKTVGRHLKLLSTAGYQIVVVKGRGCYLESNKFTKQESDTVAKAICDSQIADKQKEKLLAKLVAQQVNLDKAKFVQNLQQGKEYDL